MIRIPLLSMALVLWCFLDIQICGQDITSENAIRWLELADSVQTIEYEYTEHLLDQSQLRMPLKDGADIARSELSLRGRAWIDAAKGKRIDYETYGNSPDRKSYAFVNGKHYHINHSYIGMSVTKEDKFGGFLIPVTSAYGSEPFAQFGPPTTLSDILLQHDFQGRLMDLPNGYLLEKVGATSPNQENYYNLEVYLRDDDSGMIDRIVGAVNTPYQGEKGAMPGYLEGSRVNFASHFRDYEIIDGIEIPLSIYYVISARDLWFGRVLSIDRASVKVNQPLSESLIPERPKDYAYINEFTGESAKSEKQDRVLAALSDSSNDSSTRPPPGPSERITNPTRTKNWFSPGILLFSLCIVVLLAFFLGKRFGILIGLSLIEPNLIGCQPSSPPSSVAKQHIDQSQLQFEFVRLHPDQPSISFASGDKSLSKELEAPIQVSNRDAFVYNSKLIRTSCGCAGATWDLSRGTDLAVLKVKVQHPQTTLAKTVQIVAPVLDRNGNIVEELQLDVLVKFDRRWSVLTNRETVLAEYGRPVRHTVTILQAHDLGSPEIDFPDDDFVVIEKNQRDDAPHLWDVTFESTPKFHFTGQSIRNIRFANLADSPNIENFVWEFHVQMPGAWSPAATVLKVDQDKRICLKISDGWKFESIDISDPEISITQLEEKGTNNENGKRQLVFQLKRLPMEHGTKVIEDEEKSIEDGNKVVKVTGKIRDESDHILDIEHSILIPKRR